LYKGIRRRERSRVFPSENITRPETKDPAKEKPAAPRKQIKMRMRKFPPNSKFKNSRDPSRGFRILKWV